MHSEKTTAIVLRAVPWSETSLIVTLLTKDFGKVSAVAKGARRIKSPFDGALDLLSYCSIVFIDKQGDVLDVLTESKLIRRFHIADRNLDALNAGYYLADYLNRVTETDQSLDELFDLANVTIERLDAGEMPLSCVLQFELQSLRMLGHAPQLDACVQCALELPLADSAAAFSISAGGLVCRSCLPGQTRVIRLKNDVIFFLRKVFQTDWRSGEVPILPTDRRLEVRHWMNSFITQLLERPIRLANLLDSIPQ